MASRDPSRKRLPQAYRVPRVVEVDLGILEGRSPLPWARHFGSKDLNVSQWAGTTMFVFPELEEDEMPIFTNPLVRKFYRDLCEAVPYILYFLEPDPAFGAVLSVACAHARDDQIVEDAGRFRVDTDRELNHRLSALLSYAAVYAAGMGDDWRAMLEEYTVPPEVRTEAVRLTRDHLATHFPTSGPDDEPKGHSTFYS